MIMPGYMIIMKEERPNQICIATIKALSGATFSIPGTTYSTIITIPSYATTILETVDGKVLTTTGIATVRFETAIPGVTTMTMPFPIYGEIIKSCNKITIKEVMIYIAEKVPATIFVAMPGATYAIPGITMTIEMPLPPTTVVQTETLEGTTYKTTERFPGTTKTETIIITTTIPTTPVTPPPITTPTTTPITIITPTTTAPAGFDVMTLGIIAGVIVIVIMVFLYLSIQKRR